MEQYRNDIKSKGEFNKVRKVLVDSGLVTLVDFGLKGQAYILSGRESLPTENVDQYMEQVIQRQIGTINSNSVRLFLPYSDITQKLSPKINRVLGSS